MSGFTRRMIPVLFSLALLCAASGSARASIAVEEEEVVFGLIAPQAKNVFVVGDFNGWNPTMDKLALIAGRFEIRLYLLPGHYRYRFIVDGESVPDPENPGRDDDGNSFFILVETPAGLEITLEAPGRITGTDDVTLSPFGSFQITAGSSRDAAIASGGIEAAQGEKVSGSFRVGWEMDTEDIDDIDSNMLLIRGKGVYRGSKGEFTAFTRSADLDMADPLGLFGRIGPYRYPVGLFSRGAMYEGKMPLGTEGKVFYAGRLNGPESAGAGAARDSLFSGREMTDSDLIGLKIGSKLWKTRFAYLMRRDRRPCGDSWTVPGTAGEIYDGYERVDIDGVTCSLSGEQPVTFEVEVLSGTSRLISEERWMPGGECCPESYSSDREWEKGQRFWAGVRYRDETAGALIALEETRLEGDRDLRGGRPDGRRRSIDCAFDILRARGYIGLKVRIETYSGGDTGEVFWFSKSNFFLDGDDITIGHLPFLGSSSLSELEIVLAQRGGSGAGRRRIVDGSSRIEELHYREPFQRELTLSLLLRGDMSGAGDRFGEIRLSKGVEYRDRFGLFFDMRYVSYGIDGWSGTRDFVNAFAALYGRINEVSWLSIGVGADPYLYDRWEYAYSGLGREHFLLERGVMDAFSGGATGEALDALREAERSLSENWSITFAAFIGFW
jgi:hypothetical protein